MGIINTKSLAQTLDAIQDLEFQGKKLTGAVRDEAEAWLTERHWARGAYRKLYAPTELDYQQPLKLFTGEAVTSSAGKAHILGEEAARALIMLEPVSAKAKLAVAETTEILRGLARNEKDPHGIYCCGKCSVSMWRHLLAVKLPNNEEILNSGIAYLRSLRDGEGRWHSFTYYYTLYALLDIDLPAAREELAYALPAIERALTRAARPGTHPTRNREVLLRVAKAC
ncbi:MAG: hypothetical protein WCJ56_06885 [bacterium]